MSPAGIKWHLGEINSEIEGAFDLVSAQTLVRFYTMLEITGQIWDKMSQWMVNDFRFQI